MRITPTFCLLATIFAGALHGQTVLVSGVPAPVVYPSTAARVLMNGQNGFRIDVPTDTMRLVVRLETATPNADLDVYVRCGSDVVTAGTRVTADASATTPGGLETAAVSRPLAGAAGTCYVALDVKTLSTPITGRIIATAEPFPPGVRVQVPAVAEIMLAGQAAGVSYRGAATAPLNSPVQVDVPLAAGTGLRIRAAGNVSGTPPEGGNSSGLPGQFGLAGLTGPGDALAGVFLGPTIDTRTTPTPLNFVGAALDQVRIEPLLQQPFYIGHGLTPAGEARTFVVPAGATRFYLGVLDIRRRIIPAG